MSKVPKIGRKHWQERNKLTVNLALGDLSFFFVYSDPDLPFTNTEVCFRMKYIVHKMKFLIKRKTEFS